MNPDDLVKAFVIAGLDTQEKVQAVLSDLSTQLEMKRIDIELDAIQDKRAEAVKPLEDRRVELQNMRTALAATLAVAK